jgi:Protein of unknown function (DUF3300)
MPAEQAPPPPGQAQQPGPTSAPTSAPLSPQQLQQLVSPIALYPDSLVAQILAAATYPTQIVEAQRFLEQNSGLTGDALAKAVDQQDWDPSVKALTAFPSVLSDMNQNLSWTSSLGDANYNQPEDVMSAIQDMRRQAQQAGNLQNTPQEDVQNVNGGIQIVPANPQVVYVPVYNPDFVFGYPVGLWPGFSPWWTVGGPGIFFNVGIGIGPWMGFGWGWHNWGLGWGPHPGVWFGGTRWVSHSSTFYDRRAFMRGDYRGFRGGGAPRGFVGGAPRSFNGGVPRGAVNPGNRGQLRGFSQSPGARPGAFAGVAKGGDTRGYTMRGMSSMHGGGGVRGGGGRR